MLARSMHLLLGGPLLRPLRPGCGRGCQAPLSAIVARQVVLRRSCDVQRAIIQRAGSGELPSRVRLE
jgi:hypothetical protein